MLSRNRRGLLEREQIIESFAVVTIVKVVTVLVSVLARVRVRVVVNRILFGKLDRSFGGERATFAGNGRCAG